MSGRISIRFVDFAVFSFEFDRVRCALVGRFWCETGAVTPRSCRGAGIGVRRSLAHFSRVRQQTLNQRVPGSSLRKPHISDMTPKRAFLRGFPATRSGIWSLSAFTRLGDDFGCPVSASKNSVPGGQPGLRGARLFRVESERLKLPAPLSRWIAEALDANAAR
jgi:hypothetical protein